MVENANVHCDSQPRFLSFLFILFLFRMGQKVKLFHQVIELHRGGKSSILYLTRPKHIELTEDGESIIVKKCPGWIQKMFPTHELGGSKTTSGAGRVATEHLLLIDIHRVGLLLVGVEDGEAEGDWDWSGLVVPAVEVQGDEPGTIRVEKEAPLCGLGKTCVNGGFCGLDH